MLTSGYKVLQNSIDQKLINECQSILPTILSDPKYIDSGVTCHTLFKNKPDKFPDIELNEIGKNDLFIIANPCNDYVEIKKVIECTALWRFAALCLEQPLENVSFSFMNITRKPAEYGPSISWHRDFGNKMTSTKSSRDMVRIIIPLDKCSQTNGATAVVANSHLLDDNIALDNDAIDKDYCSKNNEVISLMPGDMLAVHSKLIHGGGANRTNRERNNLIFQFVRKGSDHLYEDRNEPFHNFSLNEIRNL